MKTMKFNFRRRKRKKLRTAYIKPKHTYKNLICLGGFGHSGSGALLTLTELDNVTDIGYHDVNDEVRLKKTISLNLISQEDMGVLIWRLHLNYK